MVRQQDNKDEAVAEEWLKQQGYVKIERPDQDPPDFVVDGKYAVEVRQLNSMIESDGAHKGEEELRKPLHEAVEEVLAKFSPPAKGRGWYVDCEYDSSKFSISKIKSAKKEIKESLQIFCDRPPKPKQGSVGSEVIPLGCGICLHLREGCPQSAMFVLNGVYGGKGFMVLGELIRSLQHSIEEKCRKIAKRKDCYPGHEWWLLLVDRILGISIQSLSRDELGKLHEEVQAQEPASRVIVISPENLEWFHEFNRS